MSAKETKQVSSKKRTIPMVTLRVYWGNDDAESSFRMPASKWKKVQNGLPYTRNTYGWYEGVRQNVTWSFNYRKDKIGLYCVDGEDGQQCVVDGDISYIFVS